MALSEHEQRLLDQIEQALYAEDPKFASAVRSARARRYHPRRWIALSIIGVLAGLAIVLVGLAAKLVFLGVIGFVLIVGACAYAMASFSRRSSPQQGASSEKARRTGGVRARMEERLRRRFDET